MKTYPKLFKMAIHLKLLFLLAMFCVIPVQAQSDKTPAPKKEDLPYWTGNLNSKASHRVKPVFSPADLPVNTYARIEVLAQVNERGDVFSAKAYSGLEPEALDAPLKPPRCSTSSRRLNLTGKHERLSGYSPFTFLKPARDSSRKILKPLS